MPLFTIEPPAAIVRMSFDPILSVFPDGIVNVWPFKIETDAFNSRTFAFTVLTVLTSDSETAVGVGAVNLNISISFGSVALEDTGFIIKSVTIATKVTNLFASK